MVSPCGSTDPLSVAEELATFVAGFVIATGVPVALSVVKVLSLPYLVPVAVGGDNPEMVRGARS